MGLFRLDDTVTGTELACDWFTKRDDVLSSLLAPYVDLFWFQQYLLDHIEDHDIASDYHRRAAF